MAGFMKPIDPSSIKAGKMPAMPNMADITAMLNNSFGMVSSGTWGEKSLAFSVDGRMLATGGYESKANIDIAAMMSAAMTGRPQKVRKVQSRLTRTTS